MPEPISKMAFPLSIRRHFTLSAFATGFPLSVMLVMSLAGIHHIKAT
jgi:hypothetical protein